MHIRGSSLPIILSFLAGYAAAYPTSFTSQVAFSGSKPKDAKVLILGGGVAGVIAARTLHEHGIDDFLIVEAGPELGGPDLPGRFESSNWSSNQSCASLESLRCTDAGRMGDTGDIEWLDPWENAAEGERRGDGGRSRSDEEGKWMAPRAGRAVKSGERVLSGGAATELAALDERWCGHDGRDAEIEPPVPGRSPSRDDGGDLSVVEPVAVAVVVARVLVPVALAPQLEC